MDSTDMSEPSIGYGSDIADDLFSSSSADTSQSASGSDGISSIIPTLGIFLCFWLGIIYDRSRCLPLCMLFHGLTNVLLSSFVLKLNWILIVGIVITTAAAVLLWLADIKKQKHTEETDMKNKPQEKNYEHK